MIKKCTRPTKKNYLFFFLYFLKLKIVSNTQINNTQSETLFLKKNLKW